MKPLCIWCSAPVKEAADLWCPPCWKTRQARKEKPADPWKMPPQAKTQRTLDKLADLFPDMKPG